MHRGRRTIVGLLCIVTALGACRSQGRDSPDYLSSELRAEVENLKREVAETPTDASTIAERYSLPS